MNHLEFAALESAMLEPDDCELWLDQLEKLVGHDLDGDQKTDGYSLDDCVRMFESGVPVESAASIIAANRIK